MKTTSLELRMRIMAAYDEGKLTRVQLARRHRVSLGLIKKLLAQRQAIGDIAPQHPRAGAKPKITAAHRSRMRGLLGRKPAMTLAELRDAVSLDCTLAAVHHVLKDMGLTAKQRRSAPTGRAVPKSGKSVAGDADSPARGRSSSKEQTGRKAKKPRSTR